MLFLSIVISAHGKIVFLKSYIIKLVLVKIGISSIVRHDVI